MSSKTPPKSKHKARPLRIKVISANRRTLTDLRIVLTFNHFLNDDEYDVILDHFYSELHRSELFFSGKFGVDEVDGTISLEESHLLLQEAQVLIASIFLPFKNLIKTTSFFD